jgi:S1-C subfamily serine protease
MLFEGQFMRLFIFAVLVLELAVPAYAEVTPSQIVLASYRVEHPNTTGTGFVLDRPDPNEPERQQLLLVTAAHVFEGMKGETATLVLREQNEGGKWAAKSEKIRIRKGQKPLWVQHPKEDVAVIFLDFPSEKPIDSLPISVLATAEDWNTHAPEPGSFIRCVGYPHAPIFKPSRAGFATTRLGCIADYPLTPIDDHPKYLVDFNIFEGNSGGPIYSDQLGDEIKIIGLVHGQHFIDERFKNIYSEGMTRKRLGLAIIESSAVILETIEKITPKTVSKKASSSSRPKIKALIRRGLQKSIDKEE